MSDIKKGVHYVLIEGQYLNIICEGLSNLETKIKLGTHPKKDVAVKNIEKCRKMINEAPKMII